MHRITARRMMPPTIPFSNGFAGIGNLERVVFSGNVLQQGTLSAQINADNAFLIYHPCSTSLLIIYARTRDEKDY
jgi:hypothetical protein